MRGKPVNMEINPDLIKLAGKVAKDHKMTKRAVVEVGIQAAEVLLKRHAETAAKADPDQGALFMRAAKLMPTWIEEQSVGVARLSDGRPALVINQEWFVGEDRHGQLMAIRRDGSAAGHISGGRIEVLRDRDLELSLEAALN